MTISPFTKFEPLPGVQFLQLGVHSDNRGQFTEVFRKEWFPQRTWHAIQMNRSDSSAGVLRGLHYHFHQVDYWCLMEGTIRVGLVDLRPTSPDYRTAKAVTLSAEERLGIYIPVGVAHGFRAVTDVTLLYVVDNYYDGADEFGLAWDDPDVGPNWAIGDAPFLSDRDASNPTLRDIAPGNLPTQ